MEGPVQDSPAGNVDTSETQKPSASQESVENHTNGNNEPEKPESAGGNAVEESKPEAQPKETEVKVDETIKEETGDKPNEEVKEETKETVVEKPEAKPEEESKKETVEESKEAPKEEANAEPEEDDEIEKLKKKPVEQLTPLEKAQIAASKAVISTLPELDPIELPPAGTGLPKHQHRYTLSAIRAIKRLKDAIPFVVPVDPIKQGVPQYFDYIKHPMDLGTMEKKLVEQKYDTIKDFIDDFNLIISNCMIFNGEDAPISHMALGIAQSFKKQLSNMPTYDASKKGAQALAAATAASGGAATAAAADISSVESVGSPAINTAGALSGSAAGLSGSAVEDGHHEDGVGKRQTTTTTVVGPNGMPTLRRKSTIDGRPKREIRPPRQPGTFFGSGSGQGRPRNKKYASELRFAGQVLKEMQGRKLESVAWPFLAPVDPIEQGVPTYFDVIKEPMDLSTIQRKLVDGIYYTGDEFESDVRLMFRNCYTFNPEGTPVNVMGHKLEDYFDSRWIDKPVPGMHNVDDSDMSDVDEEYAETGMVSPAIEVLEEQKRMINKQLKRLKKEALADFHKRGHKGGRSSAPKRRRSSNAANGGSSGHHHGAGGSSSSSARALPTEMTYEMKRQIHDQMENLSQQQIATVIAIIQESMPEMRGQDEIELEVDALDTQTQLRIYNYAVLNRADKPLSTSRAGSNDDDGDHFTRKKKSKALSEEEHAMKVAEINRKLKDIEEAKNGGASFGGSAAAVPTTDVAAGSASGAAADSDSSDEDLDSDSSSEEE